MRCYSLTLFTSLPTNYSSIKIKHRFMTLLAVFYRLILLWGMVVILAKGNRMVYGYAHLASWMVHCGPPDFLVQLVLFFWCCRCYLPDSTFKPLLKKKKKSVCCVNNEEVLMLSLTCRNLFYGCTVTVTMVVVCDSVDGRITAFPWAQVGFNNVCFEANKHFFTRISLCPSLPHVHIWNVWHLLLHTLCVCMSVCVLVHNFFP